jgi:hypothetical protein
MIYSFESLSTLALQKLTFRYVCTLRAEKCERILANNLTDPRLSLHRAILRISPIHCLRHSISVTLVRGKLARQNLSRLLLSGTHPSEQNSITVLLKLSMLL